jgi:hypothetical protein
METTASFEARQAPLPYSTTRPDGGEGLAKRKGYRREAGSEGSGRQTCESMDKNRV